MAPGFDSLAAALADRYKIDCEIGQGGMATVYLAEDLKHERQVALKVLKPELAAMIGAERFLVEIKTTANLQHPHILPLFDSGEVDGFLYYVMPYIEGETLRDRLDRETQLPVEEAVQIVSKVADALQAAHEQGIVHRDIKPANILLGRGEPVVADFGIALAVSAAAGARLTETGLSLGTPHYMSPEQATGAESVGAASDVYALGCVLYELLVGEPPHTGSTTLAVLGQILAGEPKSVRAQRKSVPVNVDAAIAKALEKLPADRFTTAAQFSDALTDARFSPAPATSLTPPRSSRELVWRGLAATLGVVVALVSVAAVGGWRRSGPTTVTKVIVGWPDGTAPAYIMGAFVAVSPDGLRLAYVHTDSHLWVRDLGELAPRRLAGTAGASNPFFSPDGESVAFIARSQQALKVLPVEGGTVRTLVADSADWFGGDWGPDGMLYFTRLDGEVHRVASGGGPIESVSRLDTIRGDLKHDWVEVLPNGKGALVTIWRGSASASNIGALDLGTGVVTVLFSGAQARFAASGHIVYATSDGSLQAVPFDQDRLTVTGSAVSLVEDVRVDINTGGAHFAISDTGTLLYLLDRASTSTQALWVARDGTETLVDPEWSAPFYSLALSPDGTQIAATLDGERRQDVWVRQLATGSLRRLTLDGDGSVNYRPRWTPDGRSITYLSDRSGTTELWVQRADGGAPADLLHSDGPIIDEGFVSPDGRWVVYRSGGSNLGSRNIRAVQRGDSAMPRSLVATNSDVYSPALSPNGRWLAYVSEETGRPEVFVQPFPLAAGVRWQVSTAGATAPVWDRAGRQLFYRSGRRELMAADVTADLTFEWSSPGALFDASGYASNNWHPAYDVSPDGERFLMVRQFGDRDNELILVINWFHEAGLVH